MSDRIFLAVVTYGRSGSTVLQRVLQTIPLACIRGENNNVLYQLYIAAKKVTQAKAEYGKGRVLASHPWWGVQLINTASFANSLAETFIAEVLVPPENARIIGFKEIRYHEAGDEMMAFLNFIKNSFENPRFLFHTRDLDETVKSGWWAKRDEKDVRKALLRAEAGFRDFAETNPAISFATTYRDLVQQTTNIDELFHFLGAEPDHAAIHAILQERLDHARNK